MASYRKRGSKWEARVYNRASGIDKPITKGGFKTKRLAIQWASELENRKLSGRGVARSQITLPEYFKSWYHAFKEPLVSDTTRRRYEYAIHVVDEYFSGQKIDRITRTAYQRFLNAYGKGHALSTSRKIHTQIRASVRSAVEDGVIPQDFTAHTSPSGHASKDRRLKYLDTSDMAKLMAYMSERVDTTAPTRMMILVALLTSARFSEVAGLTWDDISYKEQTISINKAWDTVGDTGFRPTKNPQSNRTVSVTPELLRLLKMYHHSQKIMQLKHGLANDLGLLFITPVGKVPTSNASNKTLRHALKKLDAKVITFHGLRHTHASYLLYKGVSIYYISERLGHSSYNVTLNIYSHLVKEMKQKEDQKMIAALSEVSG